MVRFFPDVKIQKVDGQQAEFTKDKSTLVKRRLEPVAQVYRLQLRNNDYYMREAYDVFTISAKDDAYKVFRRGKTIAFLYIPLLLPLRTILPFRQTLFLLIRVLYIY